MANPGRTILGATGLFVAALPAVAIAAYWVERGLGLNEPLHISSVFSVAAACIPLLIWLAFISTQQDVSSGHLWRLVGLFIVGGFIGGPMAQFVLQRTLVVGGISPAAPSLLISLDRIATHLLIYGVVHTSFMVAIVRYTVFPSTWLKVPADGMMFCTAASMGMAGHRLVLHLKEVGHETFIVDLFWRMAVMILPCVVTGSIAGWILGKAKSSNQRTLQVALAWLTGVIFLGSYSIVEDCLKDLGLIKSRFHHLGFSFGACFLLWVGFAIAVRARKPKATGLDAAAPEMAS